MWQEKNNKLTREFQFKNFAFAIDFVNKVGEIAEKLGHHPEIWFTWGRVVISTTTHDKDNTITDKDHQLTAKIDELIA